jgi:hypothetical protein
LHRLKRCLSFPSGLSEAQSFTRKGKPSLMLLPFGTPIAISLIAV